MHSRTTRTLSVLVGALLLAGCGVGLSSARGGFGSGIGSGLGNSIGEGVGRAVGDRIVAGMTKRLPAIMTPDLTNFYVGYLFGMAFHSGSYAMEQTAYAPGEWTRWRIMDGEDGSAEMERAFIARTGDGNEWWRVKYTTTSDGETSVMVLEGLFSNDKAQLVRLRSLMPGDTEPAEMPVREGAFGYVAPIPLTAESMEGAKVGVERVVVPAGTFSTNHLRYGALGGGNLDWWLTDSVPGGMVKYSVHDDGGTPSIVELTSFGKGAKSELGVEI